jgi:hypothetical protein
VEGPAVPFSHYSPLNGSTAVPFVIPSEAEGSAVISASIRCWMVALPSPLSSRPERSEVEGSAVPQTPLGNVFLQGVPNPKNQPTPPRYHPIEISVTPI